MTETEQLAEALDAAALRWPGLSRAQLLGRLALEGHRLLSSADDDRRRARLSAVQRHAGAGTGAYGTGYLERLRQDWPP